MIGNSLARAISPARFPTAVCSNKFPDLQSEEATPTVTRALRYDSILMFSFNSLSSQAHNDDLYMSPSAAARVRLVFPLFTPRYWSFL